MKNCCAAGKSMEFVSHVLGWSQDILERKYFWSTLWLSVYNVEKKMFWKCLWVTLFKSFLISLSMKPVEAIITTISADHLSGIMGQFWWIDLSPLKSNVMGLNSQCPFWDGETDPSLSVFAAFIHCVTTNIIFYWAWSPPTVGPSEGFSWIPPGWPG